MRDVTVVPRLSSGQRREGAYGIGVHDRVVADLPVQRPSGAAAGALLGRDDDHASRSLGAIDRGRRRPFEDLDRLNVVGIEVGNPVGVVVFRAWRAGHIALAGWRCTAPRLVDRVEIGVDGVVVQDHAVHDVQGIGIAVNGRHAANLHLQTAAGGAAVVRLDDCARDLAFERILECRRWHLVDGLGCHHGHRIGCVLGGDRGRQAGYDLRFEPQDILLEGNLVVALAWRDSDGLRQVPNAAHAHGLGVGRYAQRERTAVGRRAAKRGAYDKDLGCRDRHMVSGVSDSPRDAILLLRSSGRDEHRCGTERHDEPTAMPCTDKRIAHEPASRVKVNLLSHRSACTAFRTGPAVPSSPSLRRAW